MSPPSTVALEEVAVDLVARFNAQAADRMERIIRALTALAQVDHGPFRRQTVDVTSMAQAVYDGLRSTDPGRSVLFKVETGLTANAEPELVHVLLANADATRMFRPFERLGTTFAGNGIGLSIVAKIVERHGGTVSAAGEPDKGATLRFSLVGQARPPP